MHGFTTMLDGIGFEQALQSVRDIGLLPTCNVILREVTSEQTRVGFVDPQVMVALVCQPAVKGMADAAEQRLRRACASLGGTTSAT